MLVSCKVVYREVCTKGSRTTNVGTDEQKLHKRLIRAGKVAHDTNAYNQQLLRVDVTVIDRKIMLLPGEISECSGNIYREVSRFHSSQRKQAAYKMQKPYNLVKG